MKASGVRTQHPDYAVAVNSWKRCRDAAEGEKAVHAAREEYLPKLAEEKEADYLKRLKRTPFFNATWRTISGLSGMLFKKSATVEVPSSVLPLLDDCDMAGTSLMVFVKSLVRESLEVGRSGVLVDYTQAGKGPLTVAQAQAMGLRPFLQKYPAESIINWKTAKTNGSVVLSMVVLQESEPVGGNEFSHETEPRYRVLDIAEGKYRQRIFRINDKDEDEQVGEDFFPLMNGSPMTSIPFMFVGADHSGPEVEAPPMIDLVDMNLHHFSVSADYEHGCHFSGLPTLFISGYSPSLDPGKPDQTIYIGGPTANCLPSPDAKAYIVQTSRGFDDLRTNLEDKKAQMAILGARMLESQKKAAETSDTVAQHRKGEESMLSNIGETISSSITRALLWLTEWAGADSSAVKYELSKDFSATGMTAQELTAMVGAWQAGMPGYSDQNVFDQLQARGVIEEEVLFEEEQSRISEKGPAPLAGDPLALPGVGQ